jgi:Arc/MetJ-type ribon-helix-helix transcriptional regulator
MSKITFRADDDLIERIEEFDASKSEIMREALRAYLDEHGTSAAQSRSDDQSIDALVADRVDALIADRLDGSFTPRQPQDVNVNITLDGGFSGQPDAEQAGVNTRTGASNDPSNDPSHEPEGSKTTGETGENAAEDERKTCTQCGEDLSPSHVYCPNCGEKSARRVFCECGDEIRSDWSFCPGCGRRTPAADVLDNP